MDGAPVKPPRTTDEAARLAALQACDVLDTAQEACFDALTEMAAESCDTSMALVSLVDENRQWFKSRRGFGTTQTPREFSFCAVAIRTPSDPLIIPDAGADPRFRDNPLVVGPPHIRFYAGIPLVTWDGYALGTLCVLDRRPRDITAKQLERLKALADHARAQLELRRAFNELNMLNTQLGERADELRATNESLEAFAYSASHDLKAPLRRIGMLAHEIRAEEREGLSGESAQSLSRLAAEADRMRVLVDDLLKLGRATVLDLREESVDLAEVAGDVVARLRAHEPSREVEFEVEGDLQVSADPSLMASALTNLIENAWKFTRDARPARIRLVGERASDGTLVARVEDNGIGFDPGIAAGRLFTPFQRLHPHDRFQGSGVGLTTVRRIVERHGGRVWAEGEPGKGATFHFTIPPRELVHGPRPARAR